MNRLINPSSYLSLKALLRPQRYRYTLIPRAFFSTATNVTGHNCKFCLYLFSVTLLSDFSHFPFIDFRYFIKSSPFHCIRWQLRRGQSKRNGYGASFQQVFDLPILCFFSFISCFNPSSSHNFDQFQLGSLLFVQFQSLN